MNNLMNIVKVEDEEEEEKEPKEREIKMGEVEAKSNNVNI